MTAAINVTIGKRLNEISKTAALFNIVEQE